MRSPDLLANVRAMPGRTFRSRVTVDWQANAHDPKIRLLLLNFRIAQEIRGPLSRPVRVLYRIVSDWILGIDLPWQVQAGPRLRIDHGNGIVIHPQTRLGADCSLRHGVTIGDRQREGGVPTIGDRVDFGAGATVLGPITVGDDAQIGAVTLVTKSVPPRVTAVGNPARFLPPRTPGAHE